MELQGIGRYERHGDGNPVVILSNPQADPDWWAAPFVHALIDAGYQAIPFTHTGALWEPEAVVRDVGTFLDHMDLAPVSLLGWSQGAAIAQEVALARPDRVGCAALIATYGRQNAIDRVLQEAWTELDEGDERFNSVRLALVMLASYPPWLLGDDDLARPVIEGVREWIGPATDDNEPRRRSLVFVEAYQDRLEALRGVSVPCLVVGFELDADTYVARAREVAEAIPGCRYVEVANAGHLAPVTDPLSVIEPVLEFLGSAIADH